MQRMPFDSIYRHGFVRVAVCIPSVRLGNPIENAERTISLAKRASEDHAAVAAFPELGLSGYSNEDLFHQDALLEGCVAALRKVVDASRAIAPLLIVGTPLLVEEKLFNCAVAVYRGAVLGVTPKTYLPNYREFCERRQFTASACPRAGDAPPRDARPFDDVLIASPIRGCTLTSRL
jgi:NAD+ synthase (glutamine-hydrolysing)